MKNIGFSTGAISLGDFEQALQLLEHMPADAIELSALRVAEIAPLIKALPNLDLSRYAHISIHVPSSFTAEEEIMISDLVWDLPCSWLLVLHPDTIQNFSLWQRFAKRIAIENMDRRKRRGRTAAELQDCFAELPQARLCFDIGHARQMDPSMAEAYLILEQFSDRIAQVHVSEVDSQSRHAVITYAAELAFRQVVRMIPLTIPLIVESRVVPDQIVAEMQRTFDLFRPAALMSRAA